MMFLIRTTITVISLIALCPSVITSSSPFFSRSITHSDIRNINTKRWGSISSIFSVDNRNDNNEAIAAFVVQKVGRGGSIATTDEEEVIKKPKKKKKSKKVVSEEGSSSNVSKKKKKADKKETDKNYDVSTAILTKSSNTLKHTLQVVSLSNEGEEKEEESQGIVTISSSKMKSLNLFDGDTVLLKGKRNSKTVATIIENNSLSSQGEEDLESIGMNQNTMKNLKIKLGDSIVLQPFPDIKFGKSVYILPFEDSLPTDGEEINFFDDYLLPYFQGKFRTVYAGDSFYITGPKGRIHFLVVDVETVDAKSNVENDGSKACIVVDETVIEYEGEPIESSEDYDDLSSSGYDTIGGATKHIAAMKELIDLPLKHPEIFIKLGINPPRGVLLTGPSGCGKTALAKAVAAETGAYFFVINGPEVISKRAGESETNLRRAFEDALQNAADYNGAIIFLDEIDSIAPKREKAGGEVEKRIVSQLLTLMDGLNKNNPMSRVVVIGATNRASVLESALRRPGRFDRELDMGVPDVQGRLEILQIKTRDMRLSANVDLEAIAKGTHGYVGADIQQLCMEAALECIRSKMGYIDFEKERVDKEILDSIIIDKKHFDHAIGVVHPSSLRENQVEVPDVHWEDVGGLEDVKRELHETVQYPVEHADQYVKFGMSPSKGVLFYGPPGCGKTLLAKAIANECGANFISIKGPELLTQWFGESEANVRELFDKARAASPCILMFDEMDSIAKIRGSGGAGGSEAGDRVINQILTEIDGVGARKNVFVIGATNRPDILDPAVIRPGRLDQLIYIPLPDLKSRLSIFHAALRKAPMDPSIDLEVLARSTHGFSGADITEVCQTATKLAVREAILAEEERLQKLSEEDGEAEDDASSSITTTQEFLVTKRHFNIAMSKARKSVGEDDLILFEEFAEKQKAGRGEAATNFKFKEDEDSGVSASTLEEDIPDDLYA